MKAPPIQHAQRPGLLTPSPTGRRVGGLSCHSGRPLSVSARSSRTDKRRLSFRLGAAAKTFGVGCNLRLSLAKQPHEAERARIVFNRTLKQPTRQEQVAGVLHVSGLVLHLLPAPSLRSSTQ